MRPMKIDTLQQHVMQEIVRQSPSNGTNTRFQLKKAANQVSLEVSLVLILSPFRRTK